MPQRGARGDVLVGKAQAAESYATSRNYRQDFCESRQWPLKHSLALMLTLIVRRQSLQGRRSDPCSTHLRLLQHRMATKKLQMNASDLKRMRPTILLGHKLAPHLIHLRQAKTSARKISRKNDHLFLLRKLPLLRTTMLLPGSGK